MQMHTSHTQQRFYYLLNFLIEDLFHDFAQALELALVLLVPFLFLLVFRQFQTFLRNGHQGFGVVLLQLLDCVLVDGVHHVQHLIAALPQPFYEGRVLDGVPVLAGDEVDRLLVLLHA